MNRFVPRGLGWHPDLPDFRDFDLGHPLVDSSLKQLPLVSTTRGQSSRMDLREFFVRPPSDQGLKNASAAIACTSLVEYFEYRAFGYRIEPAALFLHDTAPRLNPMACSRCCSLRATLKAMVRLGVPPEDQWDRYADCESLPAHDPSLFSFFEFYRAITYLRIDDRGLPGGDVLRAVKAFLQAGFPTVFGFPVPNSLCEEAHIDYRPTFDAVRGGQAAIAVGYDDAHTQASRGALLFRSSWGSDWGDCGYGWLPYSFVEERLAVDFWTLLKPEWLQSGEFQQPRLIRSAV